MMNLQYSGLRGHCIPVDLYYLNKAKELDYHPLEALLHVYNFFGKAFFSKERFIMGLTYKENVPDTRESPVKEMVKELKEFSVEVYGYDPLLSNEGVEAFSVKALDDFNVKVDCVIVAVAHNEFKKMNLKDFLLAHVFFYKHKT